MAQLKPKHVPNRNMRGKLQQIPGGLEAHTHEGLRMHTLNHLREHIAIAIVDPVMCISSIPLHFRNIFKQREMTLPLWKTTAVV